MNDTHVDHGTEEKFCPGCYDYRPGKVEENTAHGVVGWRCLKCGHTDDISHIPHDADEFEEWKENPRFDFPR